MPQNAYEGQRATFQREFSPSTMWVSKIKLRLSSLVVCSFTHLSISPALSKVFGIQPHLYELSELFLHRTPKLSGFRRQCGHNLDNTYIWPITGRVCQPLIYSGRTLSLPNIVLICCILYAW